MLIVVGPAKPTGKAVGELGHVRTVATHMMGPASLAGLFYPTCCRRPGLLVTGMRTMEAEDLSAAATSAGEHVTAPWCGLRAHVGRMLVDVAGHPSTSALSALKRLEADQGLPPAGGTHRRRWPHLLVKGATSR